MWSECTRQLGLGVFCAALYLSLSCTTIEDCDCSCGSILWRWWLWFYKVITESKFTLHRINVQTNVWLVIERTILRQSKCHSNVVVSLNENHNVVFEGHNRKQNMSFFIPSSLIFYDFCQRYFTIQYLLGVRYRLPYVGYSYLVSTVLFLKWQSDDSIPFRCTLQTALCGILIFGFYSSFPQVTKWRFNTF